MDGDRDLIVDQHCHAGLEHLVGDDPRGIYWRIERAEDHHVGLGVLVHTPDTWSAAGQGILHTQ